MFGYYFQLGIRSLRRNPMLTALMVVTLAVGVAAGAPGLAWYFLVHGRAAPVASPTVPPGNSMQP